MDLSKALFSELEIESFNNHLSKILTDKNIDLKNNKPDNIIIEVFKNTHSNKEYERITYHDKDIKLFWNGKNKKPEHKPEYYFTIHVRILEEKIFYINVSFKSNLYNTYISFEDKHMTNKNIKLLMKLFYKWSNINLKQYKYDYNK